MKKIIFVMFAVLFAAVSLEAQKADRDNYKIMVDGLGCPFCAYGLEKKFKDFKGIKNVKIDVETGEFTFTYPSDKPLSVDKVAKQVDLAGYTPISTEIKRADGTVEKSEPIEEVVAPEDAVEASLFVAGNCNMCRSRIEKTAKSVKGVFTASWDKETKILTVEMDENVAKKEYVARAVSAAGHDTKTAKADTKVYKQLPGCCRYKRIK